MLKASSLGKRLLMVARRHTTQIGYQLAWVRGSSILHPWPKPTVMPPSNSSKPKSLRGAASRYALRKSLVVSSICVCRRPISSLVRRLERL